MSHVLKQTPVHPALEAVLDADGGDPRAALVACLFEIDRLAAANERVTLATSWGYARGNTRRTTPVVQAPAVKTEPLDL